MKSWRIRCSLYSLNQEAPRMMDRISVTLLCIILRKMLRLPLLKISCIVIQMLALVYSLKLLCFGCRYDAFNIVACVYKIPNFTVFIISVWSQWKLPSNQYWSGSFLCCFNSRDVLLALLYINSLSLNNCFDCRNIFFYRQRRIAI